MYRDSPKGDDGVVDGPANDEGGGGVQGHLGHLADAGGQPHVRQGHLHQQNVSTRGLEAFTSLSLVSKDKL